MNKLEDVDGDALRDALGEASDAKAAKRLMTALAYADGVRVETLSARYDIPRATVYSWLDRFEHRSISDAIEDESRPGRPSKLDASHRERLSDELAASPAELGYKSLQIIKSINNIITYIHIVVSTSNDGQIVNSAETTATVQMSVTHS